MSLMFPTESTEGKVLKSTFLTCSLDTNDGYSDFGTICYPKSVTTQNQIEKDTNTTQLMKDKVL